MKHKSKSVNYSKARKAYLKKLRNDKIIVKIGQVALFLAFIGLWELFAHTEILDPFFFSSPSRIAVTIVDLAMVQAAVLGIYTINQ